MFEKEKVMFKKKNSINNRLEAPIPEFKEAKKTKRKPTARQPKPPKIKEKKIFPVLKTKKTKNL
mgnify:CR=1 FL=1